MAVADWFLVSTRPTAPLNAQAAGTAADTPSKVADFLTEQSFVSLTAVTTAVKAAWKGLQRAFGGWADSFWLPLALCVLFGASQFILSITNEDSKLKGWRTFGAAAFIAITNTLVLFAAVQGIDPASDAVGITEGETGA